MRIEPFAQSHLDAVVDLCMQEDWPSWQDADRTARALEAPGVEALVAVDDEELVGVAQLLTDGAVNSYLGVLLVRTSHHGRGIGRALVRELFARGGTARIDLLATEESVPFYRRLGGGEHTGFRLYPESV
jgi:GNAT superfamily N-acetyltransferase